MAVEDDRDPPDLLDCFSRQYRLTDGNEIRRLVGTEILINLGHGIRWPCH